MLATLSSGRSPPGTHPPPHPPTTPTPTNQYMSSAHICSNGTSSGWNQMGAISSDVAGSPSKAATRKTATQRRAGCRP